MVKLSFTNSNKNHCRFTCQTMQRFRLFPFLNNAMLRQSNSSPEVRPSSCSYSQAMLGNEMKTVK